MRLKQITGICIIFMGAWLQLSVVGFANAATCESIGGECSPTDCTSSETPTGDAGAYDDCSSMEICCVFSTPAPTTSTVSSDSSKKSEATKVVSLDNPISVGANPSQIIGMIIKAFLGVVGGFALVMMVWGGFQWLTSAGNPEKVKSGTGTMLWAIIGLILVLASYLLVNTIFQFLAGSKG
jgi:type IV secretory pathway VirB2 component (pilin)